MDLCPDKACIGLSHAQKSVAFPILLPEYRMPEQSRSYNPHQFLKVFLVEYVAPGRCKLLHHLVKRSARPLV
ncbi:hypothetical protein D3C85_1818840 [compost metagenome]